MEEKDSEVKEYKRLHTLLDTYTEALLIDKNDLDTALVEQANMFYRVGEAYADCLSNRDFSKNQLDKIKAEVDRYLREDAHRDGSRLTEAQIGHLINEDESYRTAYSNYLTWKTLTEKWSALREAYSARAYALRDLVQLFGLNYFERQSILQPEATNARDRIAASVRQKLVDKRREKLSS